jgi:hypothetical protein
MITPNLTNKIEDTHDFAAISFRNGILNCKLSSKPKFRIRIRSEASKHNEMRHSRTILRGRNSQIISTIKIEEMPHFEVIWRCSSFLMRILGKKKSLRRSSFYPLFFDAHLKPRLRVKKVLGLDYIMPPMPPPIGGIAGAFSSLMSLITHSVVNNIPAIEAAFSRATRTTLVGSITPAPIKFS